MIYDKLKYILLNKLNINFIFLNLILMKFVKNIIIIILLLLLKLNKNCLFQIKFKFWDKRLRA